VNQWLQVEQKGNFSSKYNICAQVNQQLNTIPTIMQVVRLAITKKLIQSQLIHLSNSKE
jgi:hypothetical protein